MLKQPSREKLWDSSERKSPAATGRAPAWTERCIIWRFFRSRSEARAAITNANSVVGG